MIKFMTKVILDEDPAVKCEEQWIAKARWCKKIGYSKNQDGRFYFFWLFYLFRPW